MKMSPSSNSSILFNSLNNDRFKIGDAFIAISLEAAQDRLEKEKTRLTSEASKLKKDMTDVTRMLEQLKVILYTKFGKSINLER